jgi:hypothetical protein
MKSFIRLPAKERRLACQQVEERMGLQAVSVEKDFWVCWTLRELFAMPETSPTTVRSSNSKKALTAWCTSPTCPGPVRSTICKRRLKSAAGSCV